MPTNVPITGIHQLMTGGILHATNIPIITALPSVIVTGTPRIFWITPSVAIAVTTQTLINSAEYHPYNHTLYRQVGNNAITTPHMIFLTESSVRI
jgi:hypothetical protein